MHLPRGVRVRVAVLAVATPVSLAACAEIRKFTVIPHEICPGTTVKAAWDITGSPTVRTSPDLKPQSDQTYAPTTDTDFTLTAKTLLKSETAPPNTVTLYTGTQAAPKAMAQPLVFRTKCVGNVVVAEDRLLPEDWDSKLAISTITSNEDREITIEHEGKQATFTPQSPLSFAFAGTKTLGEWRVTVPLKAGESCTGTTPPRGLGQIALSPSLYCGS